MPSSAYIHIPFCKSKCKYCSFISYVDQINDEYFNAVLEDIKANYRQDYLKTIYFGGGTPSLSSIDNIAKILLMFKFYSDSEITYEINPDDAKPEYLREIKNLGINRISMGVQTFDDNVLKIIGRRHTAQDTINAVENVKEAGFKNISLDLIYGLPYKTEIKDDLTKIAKLDVEHISTYGLKIEENSYFFHNPPLNLPDDDLQADMYLEINEFFESKGYKRYEISNFSKKGFESKHNLTYWNNEEYYGFGAAAHGYCNGIRYSKYKSLSDYKNNPIHFESEHKLTKKEQSEEEIFLGFRKEEGININKINEKYNIDFSKKYKKIIEKYAPKYLEQTPFGYKLTLEGVLISNIILSEFI